MTVPTYETYLRGFIKQNGCLPIPKDHRPFSLEPVLALIEARKPEGLHPGQPTRAWENAVLGLNRGTRRAYEQNGLTIWAADRLALALGLHPSEIWGEQWWADAAAFAPEQVSA